MNPTVRNFGIAALLIGAIIWFVVANEQSKKQADKEWKQTLADFKHTEAQLDRDIQEERIKYVRLKYGDGASYLYERCVKFPPTEKQNQIKCQNLLDKIAADDKKPKEKW